METARANASARMNEMRSAMAESRRLWARAWVMAMPNPKARRMATVTQTASLYGGSSQTPSAGV